MEKFLNEIRRPIKISQSRQLLYSVLIFIAGVVLGLVSKVLDETASNLLPYFLEVLDLRNFFSRMGIWLFLAILISVYSKTPVRSGINVFLFFAGLVSSYYLYTIMIAGFFPKSYMTIWIIMTIISPLFAYVCWYAKGKGIMATSISAIIIMFISRQAFGIGNWYIYIKDTLELILWISTIFILYQTPKQIIKVVIIGMILFFLTAKISFFWGML
ncbi:hypothetical protein NST02_13700 [Robertmurraya sp. FSL W8-0741]|uniref:hypothetical protein n=1 Tax=Robertmurraya TaxID=2837507 RepID=UPI000BA5FCBA|nr:hypothetical protein [Robertmurraya siralis]PAE19129.1 hypothetical protein CHH80_18445 [Bacillus sp. 7504-2]